MAPAARANSAVRSVEQSSITMISSGGNVKSAQIFAEVFAEEAKKKGFSKVVFDRGGHLYHGRIKTFAEACRKKGLEF